VSRSDFGRHFARELGVDAVLLGEEQSLGERDICSAKLMLIARPDTAVNARRSGGQKPSGSFDGGAIMRQASRSDWLMVLLMHAAS
jgi:hypothetical protein